MKVKIVPAKVFISKFKTASYMMPFGFFLRKEKMLEKNIEYYSADGYFTISYFYYCIC